MLNTQDYINSGILELYVIGALPQEEEADVEQRASRDPAIAHEIREIREAIVRLDRDHQRAPRPDVKTALLDAIDRDLRSQNIEPIAPGSFNQASSVRSSESRDASRDTSTNVLALTNADRRPSRYLLAASWVLVALSVGAAAYFGMGWRTATSEVAALQRDNDSLKSQMSQFAQRAEETQHALAVVQDPASKFVNLAGTDHAPGTHVVVFWNPGSREVHVAANDLPMPPVGKQYQLWAMKGGKPIDAGVFVVDGGVDSLQRLKDIENADAFAVTLEREGGSPTPDLESLFALGKL